MTPRREPLICHATATLAQRVKELADADGRSTSAYIERVLAGHVAEVDKK